MSQLVAGVARRICAKPFGEAIEKPFAGPLLVTREEYHDCMVATIENAEVSGHGILMGETKDGVIGPLFMGFVLATEDV